jgi:protein-S-isoprenylcysteine O-methyltransferase Ste14
MYVYWVLSAAIVALNRDLILKYRIGLDGYALYLGFALLLAGICLAVWAAAALGIKAGRRIPEVSPSEKAHLVTKGPYRVVRHPIYLGEFLIILGVFLISGVAAVLAQFALKALFANPVITWEEEELRGRFGKSYEEYQQAVPKLFPVFWRRRAARRLRYGATQGGT